MNKRGPFIIIEDEEDDKHILEMEFKELDYRNELIFFSDGEQALDYLNKTEIIPFIILSDVNMPKVVGFELRNEIHTNEKLSIKCIPFIFFTTAANKAAVTKAYSLSVQGFFIKPFEYNKIRDTMKSIIEYWQNAFLQRASSRMPDIGKALACIDSGRLFIRKGCS